jgi:hypothetical protein
MMKRTTILALSLLLSVTTALKADGLLYDRGLPTTNLNNAAGANRSNVAWGFYGGDFWASGDDFNLNRPGTLTITDLRVWIVGTGTQPLSAMWSDLTLYVGGTTPGSITALSTVSTTGGDPDVLISPATYGGGQTYQGSSGNFLNTFQVDFLLNWSVDGSTTHTFFVGGTPTDANKALYTVPSYPGVSPMLHASNEALSGSTQEGANNRYRYLGWTDPFAVVDTDEVNSQGYGWDKPSDINVQIFGTPEPSAIVLLGTAVLAAGLAARRRVRKT